MKDQTLQKKELSPKTINLNFRRLLAEKSFFEYNITLETQQVRIRPLRATDCEEILTLALQQNIWAHFALKMSDHESISSYLEDALKERFSKTRYTFVIEDLATNAIIGSTAYGNYSKYDSRIEFGWSWIAKTFHGTGSNNHVKFLLFTFAFNFLDVERVEAKTDLMNIPARKALSKNGMIEEGVLRSHTLMPDGRRRDTIYYSLLKSEWLELITDRFKKFNFNISISPQT